MTTDIKLTTESNLSHRAIGIEPLAKPKLLGQASNAKNRSWHSKGEFDMAGVRSQTSLYEWYSEGGITEPLKAEGEFFTLNGKKIHILSGSIHYYRVHPDYWRDRLLKLKALGLNTVDTYVPWNLHNPRPGVFDFGDGNEHMSPFLNLSTFLEIAKELELFVILRPGPYICTEWDFGGLPSYLLRTSMKVRTSDPEYVAPAEEYLRTVGQRVQNFVWNNAGQPNPIIAVQVENEYGAFGYDDGIRDTEYLETVMSILQSSGFGSDVLYFTSDSPLATGTLGAIPGVLMTANFQTDSDAQFDELLRLQPDRPLMATEFWTGWFDHWLEEYHQVRDPEWMRSELTKMLQRKASVNFYMFHGGTNFGFMNGANVFNFWPYYAPDVTSYDYDALLSEAGDYTEKYEVAVEVIREQYDGSTGGLPPLNQLEPGQRPPETNKAAYGTISVTHYMEFDDIVALIGQVRNLDVLIETGEDFLRHFRVSQENLENPEMGGPWLSMEELTLDAEADVGQQFGFVVYKLAGSVNAGAVLKAQGHIRDMAYVLVGGAVVNPPLQRPEDLDNFGYWVQRDKEMTIPSPGSSLALMVENLARNNFGQPHQFEQRKGLPEGPLLLDGVEATLDGIVALQFTKQDLQTLTENTELWSQMPAGDPNSPRLYRGTLTVDGEPADTFLRLTDTWIKGVVFVNGFNLGRYWNVGPQKTLYVPAPLLRTGENQFNLRCLKAKERTEMLKSDYDDALQIVIFELYTGGEGRLESVNEPDLGPPLPPGKDGGVSQTQLFSLRPR
ncbi:unnamed protein product [Darwinula stevensoni]|uniref:Beta-galactosidase n=1 Tax=Darwinula stevensoni TaxID=69355 RepID=A0A7R9AAL9_9CRUS|nr:unnamed protein product [Darwinula stevensoni]CAG0898430.1 unnamed protein product [Darwinula stevensoni]